MDVKKWPSVKFLIELSPGFGSDVAMDFRPKEKQAVLEIGPSGLLAVLVALGWSEVDIQTRGESAAMALGAALESAFEMSANVSSFRYFGFDKSLPLAMSAAWGSQWGKNMAKGKAFASNSSPEMRARCVFEIKGEPRGIATSAQALWAADHERMSRTYLATVMDCLERLGARPQLAWEKGFDGEWGASVLPDWGVMGKSGAALALVHPAGGWACAYISESWMRRASKKPAFKALGPWMGFKTLALSPEMLEVASDSGMSYASRAIPSQPDLHFAFLELVAKGSVASEKLFSALQKMESGQWSWDWIDGKPGGLNTKNGAVAQWLDQVPSRASASKLAKELSKSIGPEKGVEKPKKRL